MARKGSCDRQLSSPLIPQESRYRHAGICSATRRGRQPPSKHRAGATLRWGELSTRQGAVGCCRVLSFSASSCFLARAQLFRPALCGSAAPCGWASTRSQVKAPSCSPTSPTSSSFGAGAGCEEVRCTRQRGQKPRNTQRRQKGRKKKIKKKKIGQAGREQSPRLALKGSSRAFSQLGLRGKKG